MVDVCGMTSLDVCGMISQYMFAFAKRKNSDTICTQWDKSGTICTQPKSGAYTIWRWLIDDDDDYCWRIKVTFEGAFDVFRELCLEYWGQLRSHLGMLAMIVMMIMVMIATMKINTITLL